MILCKKPKNIEIVELSIDLVLEQYGKRVESTKRRLTIDTSCPSDMKPPLTYNGKSKIRIDKNRGCFQR
jgi:hypothetical protein